MSISQTAPGIVGPFAGLDVPWLLRMRAETRKEHPFLIWAPFDAPARKWSYGEFHDRVGALAAGANVLGLVACSLVIGTSMGWGIHAPGAAPWLVGMAAFYSLIFEESRRFWLAPELSQQTAAFHVAVAAASLAAGAYWLFRLARLTEESDDYVIPVQAQTGSATRLERSQANRHMGRMIARNRWWSSPVDRWHDVIGDPTYADAMLDRLVHNAHRVALAGDSLRRVKRIREAA